MFKPYAALLLATIATGSAAAPLAIPLPDWDEVPIIDHDLGHGVHAIESFGGNIGVLADERGLLLIDTGYPQMAARIDRQLKTISPKPVRLVVDTHFHWDHTGANAHFAGQGALIVASPATRRYLAERQASRDNRPGEFLPDPLALPSITVDGDTTLQWGGQTLRLIRLPGTHTDGDLIVQFVEADVIQTGDALMTDYYPFIDVAHGGSVQGMIALCGWIAAHGDAATRIVPGHGPIGTQTQVAAFGAMLKLARDRAMAARAAGLDADHFAAGNPYADLDARWGQNLIKGPAFARMVFASLPRKDKP